MAGRVMSACRKARAQKTGCHPMVSTAALPAKMPASIPRPKPRDMIPLAVYLNFLLGTSK